MYNKIVGLIGPTGSGKSHLAADIMASAERVAVYQIVREDDNYLRAATDVFDGDIRGFCRALGEERFRYVYRIAEGSSVADGNRLIFPDFEFFVRACFHRRNMLMIIDEAHLVCSARGCPVYLWESVITGRHKFLDICYVTQRFAMVHRDITANSHEFVFWKITEPIDLDSIAKRCGDETAQAVAQLRKTEDNRRTGGELIPGDMLRWIA